MFILYLLTDYEGDCQRCAGPGDGRILPVSPIGCLVHIYLHSIQVNQHRVNLAESQKLKRGYIEFKYSADAIHSDLTPPG